MTTKAMIKARMNVYSRVADELHLMKRANDAQKAKAKARAKADQ